jgi:hypothetical protein
LQLGFIKQFGDPFFPVLNHGLVLCH